MSVWGLVMAKARASFTMTDIFNKFERQKKSNRIFYICILIAFAQLLKSCAENDYAERFVNDVEAKLDNKVFHINGTNNTVNATEQGQHRLLEEAVTAVPAKKASLDDIIEKRQE